MYKHKWTKDNWTDALQSVKHGSDLSKSINWSFSDSDISNLAELHQSNKFRKKIEDLLTDCNFHYEAGRFHNKKYSKFIITN